MIQFLKIALFTLCVLNASCKKKKNNNAPPELPAPTELGLSELDLEVEEDLIDSEDNEPLSINPPPSPPQGMVYIAGTTYLRGSKGKQDNGQIYHEETPKHQVSVSGFFIDQTEVTNAQFKKFVDATGYITFAEKGAKSKDFPNAPKDQLVPGANLFIPPATNINPWNHGADTWWKFIPGASWKHPLGPQSSIEKIMNHPVVCVNYHDAKAYAKWAKKRLPTEAEWELAARGGIKENKYTWGNKRLPGQWMANCFQGNFPSKNTLEDGYLLTAPVKSFPKNGYGLYDMAGNVWEICSNLYRPDYYQEFIKNPHPNPQGPVLGITQIEINQWYKNRTYTEPTSPPHKLLLARTLKGGSFLCHIEYCLRYRPAARHHAEALTPTNHVGFRCVKSVNQ